MTSILVMLMLTIVPFIFNTSETVVTTSDAVLIGSGIAYYAIFVLWEQKPNNYNRAMGEYELLPNMPLKVSPITP